MILYYKYFFGGKLGVLLEYEKFLLFLAVAGFKKRVEKLGDGFIFWFFFSFLFLFLVLSCFYWSFLTI